jgi:hypothetical protein
VLSIGVAPQDPVAVPIANGTMVVLVLLLLASGLRMRASER